MSRSKDLADRIIDDFKWEPIIILVWGPGNPGADATAERKLAYEKRVKIKKVLKKEFHRAEVHFSEDLEMLRIADGIHGQLSKEALQAFVADLILILDISRGADLELDHFISTYSWFRNKVHVFLPNQYLPPRGLVSEVFGLLSKDQLEGFSEEEFERCDVAKVKAVKVALSAAMSLYLHKFEKPKN
jgi:hypothetical protein